MTYAHWKSLPKPDWRTEPISCTCEIVMRWNHHDGIKEPVFCNAATVKVYPAMGRGWQSLCAGHARKHTEAFDACEVIASGERWA